MNVLNLFAGMEIGRLACERAGVPIDNYYSSEVDKYAIQVSKANWPGIIHLGDVTKVYGCTLPDIHLLLGGSPCQGFSFAGKQLNFNDPRSALLFEYVRILKELRVFNPNVYFLLENVMMKKEYQDVISELLGVQPVMINSALVSAQNRKRLYWTNIPFLGRPADKGIVLKDILETSGTGFVINRSERSERSEKTMCIDANYYKGADNHGQRTVIGVTLMENGNVRPYKNDGRKGSLSEIGTISHEDNKSCTHTAANTPKIIIANVNPSGRGQSGQVYNIEGKSGTLVRGNADPMLIGGVKAFARRGRVDENGDYGVNYEVRTDEKANAMTLTNQKDTGVIVLPPEIILSEEEVQRGIYKAQGKVWKSGNKMGNMDFPNNPDKKAKTLCTVNTKGGRETNHIAEFAGRIVGRKINPETNKRDDYNMDLVAEQRLEINSDPNKTNCLTTVDKDNVIVSNNFTYRKLTVTECERLQTVPDGYTQRLSATAKQISNTQAYKMLGNGWTTDVIAHLLLPLGDYSFLY